jgi:predicted GNAT family acetyltransferase
MRKPASSDAPPAPEPPSTQETRTMDLDVQHDPRAHKFYAVVDGHEAKIEYAEAGAGARRVLDLRHTFVDPALRGRGVGEALVARTLEMARQEGSRVIPTCPFIKGYLAAHPEAGEGVVAPPTGR